MQTITPTKKEVDYKAFIKRPAKESDFNALIEKDTIVLDENGRPILLYFKIKNDTSLLVEACKKIKYNTTNRSDGLITTSRIFGYDPSTGIRKQWCSSSALSVESPNEHKVITEFGVVINEIYKQYLPDSQREHEEMANSKILNEWRIPNTPFTSGIINQNNQLNYHFDSGNFNGVYSNMIVMKSNVSGGYLSLPEYDLGLQCADNTIVMFDGQSILHGVTPIRFYSNNSHRYSIVYYTLKQIWKCDPLDKELAKIRNRKKSLERQNKYDRLWHKEDGSVLSHFEVEVGRKIYQIKEDGELEYYEISEIIGERITKRNYRLDFIVNNEKEAIKTNIMIR